MHSFLEIVLCTWPRQWRDMISLIGRNPILRSKGLCSGYWRIRSWQVLTKSLSMAVYTSRVHFSLIHYVSACLLLLTLVTWGRISELSWSANKQWKCRHLFIVSQVIRKVQDTSTTYTWIYLLNYLLLNSRPASMSWTTFIEWSI